MVFLKKEEGVESKLVKLSCVASPLLAFLDNGLAAVEVDPRLSKLFVVVSSPFWEFFDVNDPKLAQLLGFTLFFFLDLLEELDFSLLE